MRTEAKGEFREASASLSERNRTRDTIFGCLSCESSAISRPIASPTSSEPKPTDRKAEADAKASGRFMSKPRERSATAPTERLSTLAATLVPHQRALYTVANPPSPNSASSVTSVRNASMETVAETAASPSGLPAACPRRRARCKTKQTSAANGMSASSASRPRIAPDLLAAGGVTVAGVTRATLITRMTDSSRSLTYTLPAGSMAMPKGEVKVACSADPSL